MALSLLEIAATNFATTSVADEANNFINNKLGQTKRYAAARLAIARSLAIEEPPQKCAEEALSGRTIKGDTLFGTGEDLAAWVALLVQHGRKEDLTRRDLQALVSAHWARGIEILKRDWEDCEADLRKYIGRLASLTNLNVQSSSNTAKGPHDIALGDAYRAVAKAIVVTVGEIARDLNTNEEVKWAINAPGGSPHMALMGSVGTGKTRTAISIIRQLRSESRVPTIVFDLKGDLRDNVGLVDELRATVVEVPKTPIPLDILAVDRSDANAVRLAALRFQETFSRIRRGVSGANQLDALRVAAASAITANSPCSLVNIKDSLGRVYTQRSMKPDGVSATFNQLCDFTLFQPQMPPAEFFSRSWLFTFPATPDEICRFVSYLVLDTLDRYLNGGPDSPTDSQGNRAVRSLVVIDEAHRLLGSKQPALSNLVRMGRSKGGIVMLVSQKPDDFENEDDDFVSDVGLFLSFRTNAAPGAAQRILGASKLVDLPDGVCIARIGGKDSRYVQAWAPA